MKFLGIDLGWSSGASGLCCLEWHEHRLELLDLQRREEIADILKWVDAQFQSGDAGVIAVDAPTIITNPTGMRRCDRLTHQYFGRYHAGCYPANLSRPFANRTTHFGQALEARGFGHQPEIAPQQAGRYQIEVFPHPATIQLFQLERILKYKKGRLADRQLALTQLRDCIYQWLPQLEPSLSLEHSPVVIPSIPTTGKAFKAVEDQLDSLICAYVGAHWWYWGQERNQILGDRQEGYIVVPSPTSTNNPD
ncbi:MAG: DUF429 domain-containing protein [Leptolyngbyaceae cyanobacterium]